MKLRAEPKTSGDLAWVVMYYISKEPGRKFIPLELKIAKGEEISILSGKGRTNRILGRRTKGALR